MIAQSHPDLADARRCLSDAPDGRLADILADPGETLGLRMLAGWYLAGTKKFYTHDLPARAGRWATVLDIYRELGLSADLDLILRQGASKQRAPFPVALGLLDLTGSVGPTRPGCSPAAERDCTALLGGIPAPGFDIHTRPGRRAYKMFLEACPEVRDHLGRFVRAGRLVALTGIVVFRVEGTIVRPDLGSRNLRRQADLAMLASFGVPADRVGATLRIVERRLDRLNEIRASIADALRSGHQWPPLPGDAVTTLGHARTPDPG